MEGNIHFVDEIRRNLEVVLMEMNGQKRTRSGHLE